MIAIISECANNSLQAFFAATRVSSRFSLSLDDISLRPMLSLLYEMADWARHHAHRRRVDPDFAAGRRGEDLAHRFLRREGFTIVARNYRPHTGAGEIDLIGWEQDQLVFVEVKTRATSEFGMPEAAVDTEKQVYLARAARDYSRRANVDWGAVRFDIVSILLTKPPAIRLIRDAFRPKRTL
jgi:putative endonuclease